MGEDTKLIADFQEMDYLKSLTILYVEDEEMTREMFAMFLRRLVKNLVIATNGADGLKAFQEHTPDIVITDVNMPIMDGMTMAREIRNLDSGTQVPIIILTAHDEAKYLKSAIPLGMLEYLMKPVDSGTLVQLLCKSARELYARFVLQEHQKQLVQFNEQLEKRVAEEVARNREKDILLLQQDKLASLGQLAAGVAHEINNPVGFIKSNLGTLKGYVQNLEQYASLLHDLISKEWTGETQKLVKGMSQKLDIEYILEDVGNLIDESLEGAERVRQIVLDLKDFARSDEATMKETDLNHCVQSTVNIVRNEIKYVAELEMQLNDIPLIVCNPQQINQVIANLLVNAAHAISGHGSISITTGCAGDQVCLVVSDSGSGIAPENLTRIFEPFFTTKAAGHGTGLGLNISNNIIKRHGGTIGVISEIGKGTIFTVTLPANCSRGALP